MRVTISFGYPVAVTIYTLSLLSIGWIIGAHFGHALSSAWMVFLAAILLLLHDAAFAILRHGRDQGLLVGKEVRTPIATAVHRVATNKA